VLQLTPQMRILVAVEQTDIRRGIDGLCRACREALGADPMNGAVFVFRNRRAHAVKALVYDGQGFWLCQKRLSSSGTGRTEAGRARRLSLLLCEAWGWKQANGAVCEVQARGLMLALERAGRLVLPARRKAASGARARPRQWLPWNYPRDPARPPPG
jgi:hypothetical protein